MLLLALLFAAVLALALSRLPWWLAAVAAGLGLAFAGVAVGLSGLERAAATLSLAVMAFALLVPVGASRYNSRVAPAKRRRSASPNRAVTQTLSDGPISGEYIPGYEVMEKIGSGGMASVYKARRKQDGRIVALKIPMEQYVADAKFIRRFHREAEVAQRLDHVNIVRTFEHGSVGIRHYMAMEYVDGRPLESFIEAGELDVASSLEIMKLVVGALQHIHTAGIIHRDIKPGNIMILKNAFKSEGDWPKDSVKLMDFGIAGGKVLARLTMTGARVGTPVYMSPEQAKGLKIDHRSDIYSLGLVFYEMLTGQTAFKGGYEAIVHQQIFQTPPPPRQLNLSVPKSIDRLVMQMIAKEVENRPGLEQVLEVLKHADDEEEVLEAASRIIVTANAKQGVLRVFDTQGNMHHSIGNIGAGSGNFSATPSAIAADSSGHLYVAIFEYRVGDEARELIHKLDERGNVMASFGPYGMGEGQLLHPVALAVSGERLYALDAERARVQCFSTEGQALYSFGEAGEGRGQFRDARSLAIGPDGLVYVLDYGNRRVQRFSAEGEYQTRYALKLGGGQEGQRVLDGLTIDRNANLYLSDASESKIRKISPDGKLALSYKLSPLTGEATDALLDLSVDDEGALYAARRGGHLIRKFDIAGQLVATYETYAPVVQMLVAINKP